MHNLVRMIGNRLDLIDRKLPEFDSRIKDLKQEEDRVSRSASKLIQNHNI